MTAAPAQVILDTNALIDYFLARDPDLDLLAGLAPDRVQVHVPELVLQEFRGAMLREIARLDARLGEALRLAGELERADKLKTGASSLREGCAAVALNLKERRGHLDKFIEVIRTQFKVDPHSERIHYLGEMRHVAGRPPASAKADGLQDCRIMEAVLEIAAHSLSAGPCDQYLLTKDDDFGLAQDELKAAGIELTRSAGMLFGKYRVQPVGSAPTT